MNLCCCFNALGFSKLGITFFFSLLLNTSLVFGRGTQKSHFVASEVKCVCLLLLGFFFVGLGFVFGRFVCLFFKNNF